MTFATPGTSRSLAFKSLLAAVLFLSSTALASQSSAVFADYSFSEPVAQATEVLTVREQGLYDIRIEGRGGSRVDVVDKMYGRIGGADAPLDPSIPPTRFTSFLEPGLYELRLAKKPGAKAEVVVERFREAGTTFRAVDSRWAAEFGRFRPYELAAGQLRYFEVLVGAENPRLDFLAVGRSLGGMALFRAGGWDTGIAPYSGRVEPEKGKPLAYYGYSRKIESGTYLVACWGGPPLPWKEKGQETDLSVMEGLRRLDSIGLHELVLGESGIDCVAVPADTTFIQASLRESGDISLSTAAFDSDRFSGPEAAIDPRGGYRTATLFTNRGSDWKWIVIKGNPGRKVELRHLRASQSEPAVIGVGADGPGFYAMRFLGSVEG
ncbi:MAG: hypothetical protein Q8M76_19255, partial [Spirochaetaceae bacterium]|nr:hypothetical protein [Spirochaetaceae bacterium]